MCIDDVINRMSSAELIVLRPAQQQVTHSGLLVMDRSSFFIGGHSEWRDRERNVGRSYHTVMWKG